MSETGYTRSPKLEKGALVQLVEGLIGPEVGIIPFQYNPEKMSRSLTPFNPFEVGETGQGQIAPTAQPFDPKETISLEIELDASDQLEDGDEVAERVGVAGRLAAIEKLLLPTQGLVGDLLNSISAIAGAGTPPARPTVPIVLFTWGVGRIVPVRITSYSVEEQFFLPTLYPIQARVSLGLEVLTPDVFKCQSGIAKDIAVKAYQFFRVQQDALALQHAASNLDALRGLLPF